MRRTTIAVAVLLFGIPAHAGIMTQTVTFSLQTNGENVGPYNQLDPSLAPLNAVGMDITFHGPPVGFGSTYELDNSTSNTISFNATLLGQVFTRVGNSPQTNTTMPVTLRPGQHMDLRPFQIPAGG